MSRWYKTAWEDLEKIKQEVFSAMGITNPDENVIKVVEDLIGEQKRRGGGFEENVVLEIINRATSTLEKLLSLGPVSFEDFNKTRIPKIPMQMTKANYPRLKAEASEP